MNALTLSIPGLSVACKTWGKPENPPILALHGWLDNANSFDFLAELLKDNYYFIAVDLPGHGHSSHLPPGSLYHFTDGIFFIIQILNALKLEQVHLLGHSMGGCLASLVGGVAPERLLSLSLIEGLGPFSDPADTACLQLSKYVKFLNPSTTKPIKGYAKVEHAALARAMKGYVSIELAKKLVERGLYEKKGIFYWRHDRRLMVSSPLRMTETQVLSCLKAIEAKTCFISASEGFEFNTELMKERIKSVKHIQVEVLEGGHHIHMEKPEVVGQLLADFYSSI